MHAVKTCSKFKSLFAGDLSMFQNQTNAKHLCTSVIRPKRQCLVLMLANYERKIHDNYSVSKTKTQCNITGLSRLRPDVERIISAILRPTGKNNNETGLRMVFYKQQRGSPWINNFAEAERWVNEQELKTTG